jgi:hypothetical protein
MPNLHGGDPAFVDDYDVLKASRAPFIIPVLDACLLRNSIDPDGFLAATLMIRLSANPDQITS